MRVPEFAAPADRLNNPCDEEFTATLAFTTVRCFSLQIFLFLAISGCGIKNEVGRCDGVSLCMNSGQAFSLRAEVAPLFNISHTIGLCNSCSHSHEQIICKMEII